MKPRPSTPDTERERRAPLHRTIAALDKQLNEIGHGHVGEGYGPGYCAACRGMPPAAVPVIKCRTCGRFYCGPHFQERVFADDKEAARYFRLRSKIHRLQADLAHGRLITNG